MRGWGAAFALAIPCLLLCPTSRAGADAFDSIGDALDGLGLFKGLQVTGRGDFSVRGDFTQGSREAYESQFWNTGMMQATTSFDVFGPIWKNFGVQAHIANSGYGYNDNRLMLGWQSKHSALLWGDLNVRLAGNEFASYTKSLKGWQLDQLVGPNFLFRAFQSKEKGLVRRQTFLGNNTSGPYFLTFTPIVEGTERVKINEDVVYFGVDYVLDYDTGQLLFEVPGKSPRIIPSTHTITVSYQSATNYESGGTTQGLQMESALLGDRLQLVLTRLEHTSGAGGAADTARFQDDIFYGSGSTGPFDVRFSPILAYGAKAIINGKEKVLHEEALIVLVDNVEQREGVDFDSLRQIGRIIFRRIVPPTSVVRIKYYYQIGPGDSFSGDSAVTGLALRHQLSNSLSWDAAFARSDPVGGAAAGNALSGGLRFSRGSKLDVNLQYRNIDPGFRYVDTVGFFRSEKGLNAAVGFRPNQHIQFAHTFSDVKTNSGYTHGYSGYGGYYGGDYNYGDGRSQTEDETPKTLDIRAVRHDSNLSVSYPGWPSLRLSRQSMTNSGGSRGDSLLETLNASLDYSPKTPKTPMTFHAGWISTRQNYAGTTTGDDSDPFGSAQSSDTQSLSLAASWMPTDKLAFATNWNSNTSRSQYKDQRGDSSNFQVSARWQPMQKLSVNLDWTQTESLGAVTSGFYGGGIGFGGYTPGMGGGWGGNPGGYPFGLTGDVVRAPIGGGGGTPDDEEPELNQYRDSSARLGISFQPSSSLSVDANFGLRSYDSAGSVGYLADSNQRYGNVSLSWLPNQDMAFNVSLGSDLLQFLDAGRGGVVNNSLTFSGTYRPQNSPFTYGLSVNRQWGVSPNYSGFGQNEVADLVDTSLFDVMANVEYRLAERARLAARFGVSDFKGGFADFMKATADIGLQYQLSNSVGLNLGWQFINNNSRLSQSGGGTTPGYTYQGEDYTTNLLVFSLSTNFQSTLRGERDQGEGLNRPITPGYGGLMGYGRGGYGSGFLGGLSLPRSGASSGDFFGPGNYSPLMGTGASSSYGSYGYIGQPGFGSLGGGFGGGRYYRGGGGSFPGSGSYLPGGGGSYFPGGGSYYSRGGLSGDFGGFDEGMPSFGGTGSAFSPYSGPYGESYGGGLEGYGGYDGDYGSYPGGFGGGWRTGMSGPYGDTGPRPPAPQPLVADPWAQSGTEFPIDDMRDV